MIKAYCILAELQVPEKLRRLFLRVRAWQVNILTSPFFVARASFPRDKEPRHYTWETFLDHAITWRRSMDLLDAKTKRKVKKLLSSWAQEANNRVNVDRKTTRRKPGSSVKGPV